MTALRVILIIIPVLSKSGSLFTITSPDIVKTEIGMTSNIRWTLSEYFPPNSSSATYKVYRGYIEDSNWIMSFYGGANVCNPGTDWISCITDGYQVGFNITNIQSDNASRYSIEVDPTSEIRATNQDAKLYIYGTPTNISVKGNVGQEGWTYNLTCYAESQSLPEEFRNYSTIQYSWSGMFSGTGSRLTIGPLYKEDNMKNVTCTAKDQGASDRLSAQQNISIIVYYKPESALLKANSTSIIEGTNSIMLTCMVPAEHQGNPNIYSYYWLEPAAVEWTNSTKDSVIIDKNTINATIHDGQWQCKVGNMVGNTTIETVNITVNAVPAVLEHPQNTTILVNDSLSVKCSFTAKPAANVTWLRGVSDSPNTSVVLITLITISSGPYTETTSSMSWNTSNLNDRRTVSDQYTCQAINSVGMEKTKMIRLDIHYWPWTISFTGPGNTSDTTDVIENTELVNRTCAADCNPKCSYTWINNTDGSVISEKDLLDLQTPTRHEAGNYTCISSNTYGQKSRVFSLNVKFSPSISVTTSNKSDIIDRDNFTLTCYVSSNPASDISLYNTTDNSKLETLNSENKAEYKFISSHCLDTGEYMFKANNSIPNGTHEVTTTVYIDVMCLPNTVSQIPSSGLEGVPLGENYTLQIEILSNPEPFITSENWSFVDYNGTRHDTLPGNVYTYVHPGTQRLTVIAKLKITNTDQFNYGNYTLYTGNKLGNMTPVTLGVLPKGPPSPPSVPRLLDITAVSLKFSWTAGFNGGLQQTFTVVYKLEGTEIEYEDNVNTEPDVNKGDIVIHKLHNVAAIKPNTTYNVSIQAENSFEGGSIANGESALFTTLVKASFIQDPEITILDDTAEIHFMIFGPLTHIIEENCVTDTNICAKYNISVPYNKAIMMLQDTIKHDFSVQVPLADTEATQFVFYFWMYDGEDLLYSEADVIPVDISAVSIGVIIAIVIAIILAAAILTTFIILWKRGIFPKKDSKNERHTTEDTPRGAYANPSFSNQEDVGQREVGPINGDTYAMVAKSGNQNTSNKPTPPQKPSGLKPEPVYVNNDITESMGGRQNRNQRQRSDLPFPLVGVDGTVYADLQVIGQPSETGLIHGIENKVEYIDIGLIKKMNS